jgi:hypothetical protein
MPFECTAPVEVLASVYFPAGVRFTLDDDISALRPSPRGDRVNSEFWRDRNRLTIMPPYLYYKQASYQSSFRSAMVMINQAVARNPQSSR